MKHLKLFFALFAMLALGVGNAWAEEVSIDFSLKGYSNQEAITDATITEGINVKFEKGSNSNSPKYYTSGTAIRAYGGNTFTISSTIGNITQIDLTFGSSDGSNAITTDAGNFSSPTWTGDANSVKFTIGGTSGNRRIKAIKVTYTPSTGGGETPDPTTYTIKWHTAKGVTTDVTLNEGETITKPATDPAMTGYEFMGWTASCDVASDGSDFTALTDFGTADSDKDFYAVFAVATTTGGGAATETTASVVIKDYASAKNWANGTKYTTVEVDANITATATVTSGSNTGKYYTSGYEWRLYQTESAKLTISANNSLNIKTVKITYNKSNSGVLKLNNSNVSTGTVQDVNASSITFSVGNTGSATNGQVKVTAMEVVYTSGGGGTTTYSDYITTCASGIEYVELGDDFKWSATEAEVTIDATDNEFPTLKNTHNVPVKYSSSDDAIATIAADGTVTLKKEGTVTITAKYEGGTSAGTGKEYKAKTVTYSLKVNKAVAQPTGTMYVKVTDAVTDGEYLIVYETGKVAFNGALTALDAVSNTIEVEINSNTIVGNTDIDKATFTLASMTGGYSIQSKSGKYIGRTSGSNGMNTGSSAIANVITFSNGAVKVAGSGSGSTTSLQYNATSGQTRFRYFTTTQKAIALYKKVDPNAVVEPIFTLAAGEYYGTQSVTISCATAGAEVYYTLDGTDPTSASTKYTGAISIASTTTVKAVAIKGANSSAVVSATYTILAPLATMQEIFDKATAVGGTATPVHITMNNWVVTGVKNSNAYVTDGTKGLIIYKSSHGFVVGDVLSGTVACKVQLYNGSSELTELTNTTDGLTVTTGGTVTPVEVTDITTLGGVNSGSVIKITGPCTVDGTNYYVAGVQLYNSLFAYTNPEEGYNYECTGVYLQYNTTKEILPRKAEDLVKIETQQPAGIKFETTEYTANVNEAFTAPTLTNPNGLTITYSTSDATLATVDATTGAVTILDKAGKVTITASFAGNEDYVAATASYNITISDPNQLEATFVAGTDKSDTKSISKNGITVEFADGSFSRDDNYRCYAGKSMTISYADGNITKIVIECTANDEAEYGPGQFTTETATYSYSGKVGTWTGEANSVTFTNIKQVRMTAITVYYKQDNRADAGLAWKPATISLTVGDAFTAPTFSNPNSVTGITFNSDNSALATVNNAGVISLKAGAVGTATITASFAGNETYKDAEVKCTISVSPKTENVVILAQYAGKWYALKAEYVAEKTDRLVALPVEYINGTLYNVADADKALITWERVVIGNKATFKNGDNYLKGKSSTTLIIEGETTGLYQWDYPSYTMVIEGSTTVRTFLYNNTNNCFRNYDITNASDGIDEEKVYSALPVVTAAKFENATIITRSDLTAGNFGTICYKNNITNFTGATFYEVAGKEGRKVIFDEVTELVAGMPYIFRAEAAELKIVLGQETATTAGQHKSLQGTFEKIEDGEAGEAGNTLEGNYIIYNNFIKKCGAKCGLFENRAYFIAEALNNLTAPVSPAPGRKRVSMDVLGENEATGVDNITENGVIAPAMQGTYDIMGRQLSEPTATGFYIVNGKKVFVVK